MKRPLATITVIFCIGIFLASRLKIPFAAVYFLAIAGLGLCWLCLEKQTIFNTLLCCLVFLLGVAVFRNSVYFAPCHISKLNKSYAEYAVKGFIASEPEARNQTSSFVLRAQEAYLSGYKIKVCGDILVYIKEKRNLSYGQELIVRGHLRRPFRGSYRDYLFRQGIFYIMKARIIPQQSSVDRRRGCVLKRFSLHLKNYLQGIISRYVAPVPAGILEAMILGERKNIPPLVNRIMMQTGTVHILVVSGFNVGIVSFLVTIFLKLIRLHRNPRIVISILFLVIYCLVTGASNPVLRATVMSIVFLSSYLAKRDPDIYNCVSFALLCILIPRPQQIFDIGFQLSFTSVLSIICLYPRIKAFLRLDTLRLNWVRYAIDSCLVSLSAWLGTVGFIAYYFKMVSPVTVLANLLIVPLATLITLCGFSLAFMGAFFPPLAPLFASSSELAVAILLHLNALLSKMPLAYFYLS